MKRAMSRSELNHLRRLVAWIDCEVGPTTDELTATLKKIAPHVGITVDAARASFVEDYLKAESVPKYIRDGVKQLQKYVRENDGYQVVAGESEEVKVKLLA